jgi:16S rRNA (guanine966-N2)-methyltransferase
VRIVAGSAGGLEIAVPKTDLRPTMDRVRGAIFSSLGEFIVGARVLDIFAGSGGLGIEALSRGAASAVFVESDRRATATIGKNLEHTRLTGTIHTLDIFDYLDRLAGPASFDAIFADPPYAKKPGERDFAPELLRSDSLRHALKPGGIFILEHLPHAPLAPGTQWEVIRDKRYGATSVAFLRATTEAA